MSANDKSKATGFAGKSTDNDDQVRDQGTTHMSGDEVANAAAESLHGGKAEPEQYEQPGATVLPGGSTLISDENGEPPAGTKRDDA